MSDPEQPRWFDGLSEKEKRRAIGVIKQMYGGNSPYTFHRGDFFYPIELASDEDAIANAKCNPGTTKVVNELTVKTVWEVEV